MSDKSFGSSEISLGTENNGHALFLSRLDSALKQKSMSRRALAKTIGASQAGVNAYWAKGSEPSRSVLIAISLALDVSLDWLATGAGPKTRSDRSGTDPRLADDDVVAAAITLTLSKILELGRVPPPALTRGLFLDNLEVASTAASLDDADQMLKRIISSVKE